MITTSKLIKYPSTHMVICVCVCVVRALKTYPLSKHQVSNTGLLVVSLHTIYLISRTYYINLT